MLHALVDEVFEYLDSDILLFHACYLSQELRIEDRELLLHIGKEIDDAIALDTLFEQGVDAFVDALWRKATRTRNI